MDSLALRYLRLGLGLDRHVEGTVDAYFGPPGLAEEIAAAPPPEPASLVADAEALLSGLDDSWLRDQARGLHTCARVLAGEPLRYADEVEGCFGVRPVRSDEALFAAAHAELDDLLPGRGSLLERLERWERSTQVPAEHVTRLVGELCREARAWTSRLVELPAGERVEVEGVRDVPWLAFCAYRGGYASRISVNLDLPVPAHQLLVLTLHETYPGHHAERACKDARLVQERGLLEEAAVLVPTPQSLVSEGIASVAPLLALESELGPMLAGIVRDAGVDADLEQMIAVHRARGPLEWAEVNAALMLHEDGAPAGEVTAYLSRWALATPEIAAHLLRFMSDPTSRSYIVTYPAGRERCAAWVDGDLSRLAVLLTEQVRAGELAEPRPGGR